LDCVYLSLNTRKQRNSKRFAYVFGVQLSNEESGKVVRQSGKKSDVENPKWRPLDWNYLYLSLLTIYERDLNGSTNVIRDQQFNGKTKNNFPSNQK